MRTIHCHAWQQANIYNTTIIKEPWTKQFRMRIFNCYRYCILTGTMWDQCHNSSSEPWYLRAYWGTRGTLQIMLFVRPTRGHGGRYRVNIPIKTTWSRPIFSYPSNCHYNYSLKLSKNMDIFLEIYPYFLKLNSLTFYTYCRRS